jgi:hypothetical protein
MGQQRRRMVYMGKTKEEDYDRYVTMYGNFGDIRRIGVGQQKVDSHGNELFDDNGKPILIKTGLQLLQS